MSYQRLRPTFTFDADRLAQLRAIAPEAFADGAINWEALRAALGEHLEEEGGEAEHFGLFWPGKRAARRRASEPSRGTLIPVPGEGVDEATTRNIFIEADNLDALKLLQKAYAGRVKMIYIDPPYNTGNDFVYRDDFREAQEDYLRRTGQVDEAMRPLTTNARTGGRFHSNWLNMIYPRLLAARTMLRDDGVIFVSIDDNEIHNLRLVMDEVFGAENFVALAVWQRVYSPRMDTDTFSTDHEYLIVYRKSDEFTLVHEAFEQNLSQFNKVDAATGRKYRARSLRKEGKNSRRIDAPNSFFPLTAPDGTLVYPIRSDGSEGNWRWSRRTYEDGLQNGIVEWIQTEIGWQVYVKQFYDKEATRPPSTIFLNSIVGHTHEASEEVKALLSDQIFENPKPLRLIRKLLQLSTLPIEDTVILDFFAGSGTTAHAVMEQNAEDGGNRQFILVQLPEETGRTDYPTISAITAERIRRAGRKIAEERGNQLPLGGDTSLDLGFRFYRFAPSNYRAWQDYEGDDLRQLELAFDATVTPLIDGWQPDHLLTEVMLHLGFPLDSTIEALPDFTANALQRVTSDFHAHSLFACFDASIAQATIDALTLGDEDIFVCLDSALTDEAKARLADVCNLRTI